MPAKLLAALFVMTTFAGCASSPATTSTSPPPEPEWVVAQSSRLAGDVGGYAWEVPGASDSSGDAAAASTTADAAAASRAREAGVALLRPTGILREGQVPAVDPQQLAGLALEVVPDVSTLADLQDYAILVFTVKDGVAEHVETFVSSTVTRTSQQTSQLANDTVEAAAALPFVIPLKDLGLAAGDQLAFVMASVDKTQAVVGTAVDAANGLGTSLLPVQLPDAGFAMRLVDAAQANAEAAAEELAALAVQGQAVLAGAVKAAGGTASDAVRATWSTLDQVAATGKALVLPAVGQTANYAFGLYAEATEGASSILAAGSAQAFQAVSVVAGSMVVQKAVDAGLAPLGSVQNLDLSYAADFATGFGFSVGAYAAEEAGNVVWQVDAAVGAAVAQAGDTIRALGPLYQVGVDPSFALEATGAVSHQVLFTLERSTQDAAMVLSTVQMSMGATIEALVGATSLLPVQDLGVPVPLMERVGPQEIVLRTASLGTIHIQGI